MTPGNFDESKSLDPDFSAVLICPKCDGDGCSWCEHDGFIYSDDFEPGMLPDPPPAGHYCLGYVRLSQSDDDSDDDFDDSDDDEFDDDEF